MNHNLVMSRACSKSARDYHLRMNVRFIKVFELCAVKRYENGIGAVLLINSIRKFYILASLHYKTFATFKFQI